MKKVGVFLVNGFEPVEAFTPIDILRRCELDVEVVSLCDDINVNGSYDVNIIADKVYNKKSLLDYDCIIMPGGAGTKNYNENIYFILNIKEYNNENKLIASICAGPTILAEHNILNNKDATCFPTDQNIKILEKNNCKYIDEEVVVCQNIITSKAIGTSHKFALEIAKYLLGKDFYDKYLNMSFYQ